MRTSKSSILRSSSFLSTAALLIAALQNVATAADAPARSVKDLKIKVSSNGRYLVDQEGKPFFYLGDTCWLLFQRPDRDELEEYLKDRAAKGFTVIQAYVLRGLGKQHPDGNSSLLDETPLLDRDPTRPNEAFFKHVDQVIDRANELGLVMGLVTAKSWHVNQHPEKVFDEKNAYVFGKFLGQRYRNNAVIWFPGGDSPPGKDEAIWVAMARGLKDGCGGSQLVCYHGQGSTSSSMWFHQADWLDFNSIQSGHNFGSDSYAFVSKDYALTPPKPTLDMEPAYENHPTGANQPRVDAHKVRTQAYAALLAGAAGHGYGSLDLFYFYKEADGPFPRNGFLDWRRAIAYPGSREVGLMRRLFEERPWYKMVPDQSVLASEQGGGPYRLVAARAADGSFAVAYTPRGKPLGIHLDKLRGSPVKARWYDPRQGSWSDIGQSQNQGTREFVPPSSGEKDDWVLVLDAAAGFPAASDLPARPALPDPLVFLDGRPVAGARQWTEERRPELEALFEHYMYGAIPPRPDRLEFRQEAVHRDFLEGKATLKLVTVTCGPEGAPRIDLMVIVPNARRGPAPVFLALNFCGNHAITADRRIPLTRGWTYSSCRGSTDGRAGEEGRGSQAEDWAVDQIVDRGYALASFASSDVDADQADRPGDLPAWLARAAADRTPRPATRDRGTIALWAWGFHRAVDYLVTDPDIDGRRIAAVGHSRNGKTALLAAAFDERIALAIPHQAGCGGTAPSRGKVGESVKQINDSFPHWFNAAFKEFNERPDRIPFDQHCLVALCAPRPVLLSNAVEDTWANPDGQFEVLRAAEPVYRLLEAGGLESPSKPEVGKLSGGALGYFIRPGKHSMTREDWKVFLDFADRHLGAGR